MHEPHLPNDPPRTGPRHGPRWAHGLALPPALFGLLLLVVLAACGSAAGSNGVATLVDPSASPSGSPSASLDPEDAMQAFEDCMRQHGVDIEVATVGGNESGDGSASGPGVVNQKIGGTDANKAKFEAADRACHSLLPRGGVNGPDGTMDPAMQDKFLAFSACMREHGIDMPDPQFSGGGVTIGGEGDTPKFDPRSQAFKDAEAACNTLLPGKPGGGPTTQESKP
jgi:hypothetical protein